MAKIIPKKISISSNDECSNAQPKRATEDLLIDIFNSEFTKIKTEEDLREAIKRLYIRFNTEPKLYQKFDFGLLVRIIISLLLHLSEGGQSIILGENFKKIAKVQNNVLDLIHPVVTDESDITNPEETLSSVQYNNDNYILKWEAF